MYPLHLESSAQENTMSALLKPFLTQAEYLQIERKAEFKSEYFQGEMFAMSGASRRHNLIAVNLTSGLHRRFREQPCEVYSGDMRVKVQKDGLYTYPDVVVVGDRPELEDKQVDTLLNPLLILEILSPSTEAYDRGKKFEMYQGLDSLQHYLLVAQDRPFMMHYHRQGGNDWLLHTAQDLNEGIVLDDLEIELPLAEIYERVEFEQPSAAP
jgi:Uma2 family endonuclease